MLPPPYHFAPLTFLEFGRVDGEYSGSPGSLGRLYFITYRSSPLLKRDELVAIALRDGLECISTRNAIL